MKKKTYLKSLVGALAVAMLLSGCGSSSDMATSEAVTHNSSSSNSSMDYATEEYYGESSGLAMSDSVQVDSSAAAGKSESGTEVQDPLEGRKLIKTVDMNVETKEFDMMLETLETRVSQLGGYIENLDTNNGSMYSSYRSNRYASMTIRVPQKQLNTFMDEVGTISNVVYRSESVSDVTLSYVDLESHKEALQTEYDRLLELVAEAQELEDILTIEERLTNVRYQLESMESQLRTYDNKINYSTIYLSINEVKELTPVEEETTWQRITNGFMESLQSIADGFVEFAIWFVVNIPYFILWIVIIVVIILVIKGLKKILKSGKKKKGMQPDNTEQQK